MKDESKTKAQLITELKFARGLIKEANEKLEAKDSFSRMQREDIVSYQGIVKRKDSVIDDLRNGNQSYRGLVGKLRSFISVQAAYIVEMEGGAE